MRIEIRKSLPDQFYLCKMKSYKFYQEFFYFTNSV